jgi:hypothetical protein
MNASTACLTLRPRRMYGAAKRLMIDECTWSERTYTALGFVSVVVEGVVALSRYAGTAKGCREQVALAERQQHRHNDLTKYCKAL